MATFIHQPRLAGTLAPPATVDAFAAPPHDPPFAEVVMSETLLSSRNLAFELYEVLDAEALTQRPRFAEHSRETFD
ncbi:acyl-CoA dehydrogenase N-terminal domain-containing protein, partial [Escherichia coli]|nr:acyl-CoA dehydrogenase N-terminal domain-containing protein [Escherichia coli]